MRWQDQSRNEANDSDPPVPSEEEIRQRAAAIRETWSANTRRRRRVIPDPPPLTVLVIRVSDLPSIHENN